MAKAAERAGWTTNPDGSISFRNRIGSRARARAEATALGHVPGPFTGMGGGAGLTFTSTCGRCGASMIELALEQRLLPGGMLSVRCGQGRRP